jgi:hypothetical protein
MNKKNILLLTLVHPDFLPPVYSIAQVLRDSGYNIHILTFDSYVPAQLALGPGITVETMGRHDNLKMSQRILLRKKYTKRAAQLVSADTRSIISFCPFSYLCGLEIKRNIPLIYIALEIADFVLLKFPSSPLTQYRNYLTFKNISKADLVATPSIQRSAWLAGRCHLDFMPHVILNTAYVDDATLADTFDVFKEIVPVDFLNKKIILYTGAVNSDQCILELVQAFDLANDAQSALIITGIKENEYCESIKNFVHSCKSRQSILLLPYVARAQMLALQSNAHIGACLTKENKHSVESSMIAPNKVGEYTAKGIYILGLSNEYMRLLQAQGIATLSDSATVENIARAIADALQKVNNQDVKSMIGDFVKNYFCMQQQIKPVLQFVNKIL